LFRRSLLAVSLVFAVTAHGAAPRKKTATVRPTTTQKAHATKRPPAKKPKMAGPSVERLPAEVEKKAPVVEAIVPAVEAPAPSPMYSNPNRYRREFESGFGQMVLREPAVVYTAQTRFGLGTALPLYIGADLQFALFSPGYFFTLLPGIWYDFVLFSAPSATLSLGVLAGPAFAHRLAGVSDNGFAAFGEASLAFEIDDLSTVRGQFRPGIVGGRLAFVMTMLIGFRFR